MTQYVFLSYVSEDAVPAARLANALRSFGISVWRDRDALQAGDRWRAAISAAISQGAAFICCYSMNSESRARSFMREEVLFAISELQMRSSARSWFIPVLLDGTKPRENHDIGGGAVLSDIHYVDMSQGWDVGVKNIITGLVSEHQPSERARLAKQLDVATALERLAVSENLLVSDPLRALPLTGFAERAPAMRAASFRDLVEEGYCGVSSIHEFANSEGYYGATHLPSQPVAISGRPVFVVWSGRGGHVGVFNLEAGSTKQLPTSFESAPDVFINRNATLIAAVHRSSSQLRYWSRISADGWRQLQAVGEVDWDDMMPFVGSNFASLGGRLFVVEPSVEGAVFADLLNGTRSTLRWDGLKYLGVDPTGNHLTFVTDEKAVQLARKEDRLWRVASEWSWPELAQRLSPEHPSIQPHGVRVRVDGVTILQFPGCVAVLPIAEGVGNAKRVRSHEATAGTLLPQGLDVLFHNPFPAAPSDGIIGLLRGQYDARVLGRFRPAMTGLSWACADPKGRVAAFSDENGRMFTVRLETPGPSRGGTGALTHIDSRRVWAGLGHFIVFEARDRVLVVADVTPEGVSTALLHELGSEARLLDLQLAREAILATYSIDGALARVCWWFDEATGGFHGFPKWSHVQSLGATERPFSETAKMDGVKGTAMWQTRSDALGYFDIAGKLQQIGEFNIAAGRKNDIAFGYSELSQMLAVVYLGGPLQSFDLSTPTAVGQTRSTGLGRGGGAWGDQPADIMIVNDVILLAKKSGSLARWRSPELEPAGASDLWSKGFLEKIFLVTHPHHGRSTVLISTTEQSGWVVRGCEEAEVAPRYFTGIGDVVGVASRENVLAMRDGGAVVRVDLSEDAIAASTSQLARISGYAQEIQPLDPMSATPPLS